jgi:nucleoside phosphorylase
VILIVAATERELCGHDGLVCGVGPVEAAASTARALAVHPITAVLHVGLAGARGLEPGTLVVGTEAVYCDLSAQWPVIDRAPTDPDLRDRTAVAVPAAVRMPIHTSAAVGGACNSLLQGPLVEAMEGFGVLRAAARAGVPAVEVRAISNAIGEADRARWDLDGALTALAAALPPLVAALEPA